MINKSWFTCRIRYQKLDESGKEVKATESYLLDAYSFTEAETRIIDIMTEMIRGNFQVVNITKSNLSEVVPDEEAEKWFKVKVALIIYDEESGKEKQSTQHVLIAANDVKDAYEKTQESMKGSVSSYVIPAVNYTKIVEVFAYTEDEELRHRMEEKGMKPLNDVLEKAENMNADMSEAASTISAHESFESESNQSEESTDEQSSEEENQEHSEEESNR
jgi:hypothetical protein